MKKVLLGFLLLGTMLFGDAGISLGYNDLKVGENKGSGGDIAFKYSNYYDIMYWGGRLAFEYGNVKDSNVSATTKNKTVMGYSADIRLGITPVRKTIAVYGIFAAMYQSVNDIEYGGFGTGGGMEFKINRTTSISIDYTSFNMTPMQSPAFAEYKFDKTLCAVNFTY